MSKMIEVYLGQNGESSRSEVVSIVNSACGKLTYEEGPHDDKLQKGMCLTFEFETIEKAEQAIRLINERGFHVEGPVEY